MEFIRRCHRKNSWQFSAFFPKKRLGKWYIKLLEKCSFACLHRSGYINVEALNGNTGYFFLLHCDRLNLFFLRFFYILLFWFCTAAVAFSRVSSALCGVSTVYKCKAYVIVKRNISKYFWSLLTYRLWHDVLILRIPACTQLSSVKTLQFCKLQN